MSTGQRASNEEKKRIVVLCGPRLSHLNTCATLVRNGLNVVGFCVADQRRAGLPLSYIVRSVKRRGVFPTFSRATARLVYSCIHSGRDNQVRKRLFNQAEINATLQPFRDRFHYTKSYSGATTLAWLKEKNPDVLVVHTPYWVGRNVRNLARSGIVLGGHPGITPRYRGSHSAFWALYFGQPEDVGCTVFLVDAGVDTGDVVAQQRIPIEPGDSFMTLGWKGMIRIAELQAAVLRDLDRGIPLPRKPVTPPPDSVFENPTFFELLRYWNSQHAAR